MNISRRWLIPVLSIAAPLSAHADAISHRDVTALTERGIALARASTAQLPSDFILAIGGGAPTLLLREIQLCVDDAPCTHHEYSVDEGKALASGGLDLPSLDTLSPGKHRLRADVIAVDPLAPPYSPRTRAKLDLAFDSPGALELGFTAAMLTHGAQLTSIVAHDSAALRSRAARFLTADNRPFEAAAMSTDVPIEVATTAPVDAFVNRYNEAVALIDGTTQSQGFEQLRALTSDDHADPWLRDRAGMTLGEQLLRAHRNTEAAQAFRSVRSPGPFANRALLELGWTSLLPTADASVTTARPASYALPSSQD
jgi:hypothetical protein